MDPGADPGWNKGWIQNSVRRSQPSLGNGLRWETVTRQREATSSFLGAASGLKINPKQLCLFLRPFVAAWFDSLVSPHPDLIHSDTCIQLKQNTNHRTGEWYENLSFYLFLQRSTVPTDCSFGSKKHLRQLRLWKRFHVVQLVHAWV